MIRVDPLTGTKSLIGAIAPDAPSPAPDAYRDLFAAQASSGQVIALPHDTPLAQQSATQFAATMAAWQGCLNEHTDARFTHLTSTEPSSHAELHVLDQVPALVARERERANAYTTRTMGMNLLADYVEQEVKRDTRIVAIDKEAVLLCPYASRAPFQLLLAPRKPRARMADPADPFSGALLQDALQRLARQGREQLTLFVRDAPEGTINGCWRIELLPLAEPTALERGTGMGHCDVSPEDAAAALRG